MKHSIRQRVLDPITGMMVTKIEQVTGELGSGILDKNGKEIFEGDLVKTCFNRAAVEFKNGAFYVGGEDLFVYARDDVELEVVGHVDD